MRQSAVVMFEKNQRTVPASIDHECDDIIIVSDKIEGDDRCDVDKSITNGSSSEECKEHPAPAPYLVEIKHLKRRISNVQEISIQTSRDAIASDVEKYQNNVLNATRNCVNEWRAIARHYGASSNNNNDNSIPFALRKETGLLVFQLIQLSCQSGPLSGAKPGYFRRCGAKVAQVVYEFLEDVVPQNDELGECMGFSSKQIDVMKKWKINASKAIESGKPPSKSVMKKMQRKAKTKK